MDKEATYKKTDGDEPTIQDLDNFQLSFKMKTILLFSGAIVALGIHGFVIFCGWIFEQDMNEIPTDMDFAELVTPS